MNIRIDTPFSDIHIKTSSLASNLLFGQDFTLAGVCEISLELKKSFSKIYEIPEFLRKRLPHLALLDAFCCSVLFVMPSFFLDRILSFVNNLLTQL